MKLVVDTNIILKALIKRAKVRAILLNPNHQFYVPEHAMEEIEKHLPLLSEKTGLSGEEVKLALSIILTNVRVVSSEDLVAKWGEASKIMRPIDSSDIPLVAAVLSIQCDGLWSDDKDFERQERVRVWSTTDMIRLGYSKMGFRRPKFSAYSMGALPI